MPNDTYRRGLELLEKLHGGQAGAAMVAEMNALVMSPDVHGPAKAG